MRFSLASMGCVLILTAVGCNKGSDAASGGSSPSGWKEFAPEQDKFSVRMPGDPAPQAGNDPSGTNAWSVDGGNLVYLVRYTPLSDPAIEQDQARIEGAFDNIFGLIGITENLDNPEQKKPINVAGVTGREIEATTADKKTKRIRLCIAGGRTYRMEVIGSKEAVASPDAEVFFNSLKIGH